MRMDEYSFAKQVQEYLRGSGYSQQNLANALGLHPGVLSRKLNASTQGHLTKLEVGRIIKILAEWNIITMRDEALQLLKLANLKSASLSIEEWQEPPLNRLAEEPTQPTLATISKSIIPAGLHNIPSPVTRLIGREWAVERLQHLLGREDARLVTLVGPGGSGKTRLALHVAGDLVFAFAQGVWLVNLTTVTDAGDVPMRIMQALDLIAPHDVLPIHFLIKYFRDKQLLLVLDNFEQVEEAAPVLGDMLAAAPRLKMLVTSRRVLHVYGEHRFNVPPLDVPNLNALPNTTLLSEYPAIELFMERVQAVKSDIVLDSENGAFIAQICARLDGLPLALELAAGRAKMLSLEQLLERLLDAPLPVLIGGARNLPWKLQTLHNSFEWSFDLLSPDEKQSLTRLGVFSGGWSLERATAMMQYCDAAGEVAKLSATTNGAYKAVSRPVSDMLEALVDKSLLVWQKKAGGQVRFTMMETLREYVLSRLVEQGEYNQLRDWHACYYLALAEDIEEELRANNQPTWLSNVIAEQENFRTALQWSYQRASTGMVISGFVLSKEAKKDTGGEMIMHNVQLSALELHLQLAAVLYAYWEWLGSISEGRKWLEAALTLPFADEPVGSLLAARARALDMAAQYVQ